MLYLLGAIASQAVFTLGYKFTMACCYDVDRVTISAFGSSGFFLALSGRRAGEHFASPAVLLGGLHELIGPGAQLVLAAVVVPDL